MISICPLNRVWNTKEYLKHLGASINKVPIGIFLAEKLEGSLQRKGLKSHNVAPFASANKTYIMRKLYDRRGRLLKSKVPREDVPNARKKTSSFAVNQLYIIIYKMHRYLEILCRESSISGSFPSPVAYYLEANRCSAADYLWRCTATQRYGPLQ